MHFSGYILILLLQVLFTFGMDLCQVSEPFRDVTTESFSGFYVWVAILTKTYLQLLILAYLEQHVIKYILLVYSHQVALIICIEELDTSFHECSCKGKESPLFTQNRLELGLS